VTFYISFSDYEVEQLSISKLSIDDIKKSNEETQRTLKTVAQSIEGIDVRVSQNIIRGIRSVPAVSAAQLHIESRPDGYTEFCGIKDGLQPVVCVPYKTKALDPIQVPRLVENYTALSNHLHVQTFYGILNDTRGEYLVLEDLKAQSDVSRLKHAPSRDEFSSASPLQKLLFCYEITITVASFHKANIVVKVLTDSFIFVRFKGKRLLPIFTELDTARAVSIDSVLSILIS
jgi:hypothetical protein